MSINDMSYVGRIVLEMYYFHFMRQSCVPVSLLTLRCTASSLGIRFPSSYLVDSFRS